MKSAGMERHEERWHGAPWRALAWSAMESAGMERHEERWHGGHLPFRCSARTMAVQSVCNASAGGRQAARGEGQGGGHVRGAHLQLHAYCTGLAAVLCRQDTAAVHMLFE